MNTASRLDRIRAQLQSLASDLRLMKDDADPAAFDLIELAEDRTDEAVEAVSMAIRAFRPEAAQ